MSIISTQMVSALNNYNSITPLLTKDLIENGGRTAMAYCSSGKETRKYETAEKFIDANMSSIFWFGAIPFANKIFNMTAFKASKLNPNVSLAYLKKGEKAQTINGVLNKIANGELPEKIMSKANGGKVIDAKAALEKVNLSPKKFKNLQVSRMLVSLAFATYLSAVVLPKSIIALTQFFVNKNNKKPEKIIEQKPKNIVAFGSFETFIKKDKPQKSQTSQNKVSFKSVGSWLFNKAVSAQSSALDGMAAMDIGISSGRIYYVDKRQKEALNGRNKEIRYASALEKLIREAGAFYLIYFGGNHIKKGIDKFTKNPLDPVIIEDKSFVKDLKSGLLSNNPIENMSDKQALDFIDQNINNESQPFIRYAKKLKWIETAKSESGQLFRNPLKYVDINSLSKNFETISKTSKEFLKQGGENLEKFVSKKAKAKRFGIYANLAVSSFAVCYVLPKIMYGFRKFYTGSNEEPGIKEVINNAKDNSTK